MIKLGLKSIIRFKYMFCKCKLRPGLVTNKGKMTNPCDSGLKDNKEKS